MATTAAAVYKLILLGGSSVGKTALALRYAKGRFSESAKATIGVDFFAHRLSAGDDELCLELYDTAGQERYARMARTYYAGASGIVLVFSLAEPASLDAATRWMQDFIAQTGRGEGEDCVPVLLIGNKSDLPHEKELVAEATEMASDEGWFFFCASALSGEGVTEAIDTFAKTIHEGGKRRLDVVARHLRSRISGTPVAKASLELQASGDVVYRARSGSQILISRALSPRDAPRARPSSIGPAPATASVIVKTLPEALGPTTAGAPATKMIPSPREPAIRIVGRTRTVPSTEQGGCCVVS